MLYFPDVQPRNQYLTVIFALLSLWVGDAALFNMFEREMEHRSISFEWEMQHPSFSLSERYSTAPSVWVRDEALFHLFWVRDAALFHLCWEMKHYSISFESEIQHCSTSDESEMLHRSISLSKKCSIQLCHFSLSWPHEESNRPSSISTWYIAILYKPGLHERSTYE